MYIFDNGSTSLHTLAILDAYAAKGVNINFDHPAEYERNGAIIGDKIANLEQGARYDFCNPMDCDEFLVLQRKIDDISCDKNDIIDEFSSLNDDRAFRVKDCYFNVLGFRDRYRRYPTHDKTFFKSGTFDWLDHGHHAGQSRLAPGKCDTRFAHIHFHNKPYDIMREHSKNKLRPFVNVDDPIALKEFNGCGQHLTRYLLESEEAYLAIFSDSDSVKLPQFSAKLRLLGMDVPYAVRAVLQGIGG